MFEIIPAIDLKGRHCVRLTQGKAEDERVYSQDPVAMAEHWQSEGAGRLHVIDLDGAFRGAPYHAEIIVAIAGALTIPVQVGGGIRTTEDARRLLDGGVDRIIIGTKAISEPEWIQELVEAFGRRVVVGIDARDGKVQVKGWVETSDVTALELAKRVEGLGVQTIIYTDTSRDGMLVGPNLGAVREICAAVQCEVIASGGIKDEVDVGALRRLGYANLGGVIIGKALYEGCIDLREVLDASAEG